jgi:NAD+ synthetase
MCGGLAPIGDLYKTQVYALAQYMNRATIRIPESTQTKPPSAELKPNQVDQDTLPEYAVLDTILMGYIESGKSADQLVHAGYDADTVSAVIRMVKQSEYKRHQAAPVIKVSARAFDWGWRQVMAS